MTVDVDVDVAVVGGGPAGSTVATLLRKAGWSVSIFEKEKFPRHHIGEALIPSAVPVLEELGVKEELDRRGYLKKRGTTFIWGDHQDPWTVYFVEGNPSAGYSYQMHRPDFDQLLLHNSAKHGAKVYEKHTVTTPVIENSQVVGLQVRDPSGHMLSIRSRLVVDASGQSGFLSSRLCNKVWDQQIRNMAIYGYFAGAKRLPGIDATNTLVEGYDDGWFWAIPLHVGLLSVGTVMDHDQYKALAKGDLKAALLHQISKTRKVRELVETAEFADGPYIMRDWSYANDSFWGGGFALVGDAACFIDPLFSTGVFLGMQHAQILTACINSVLRREVDEKEAFGFYEEEYRKEYQDLRQICLAMYGGAAAPRNTIFWNARKIQELPDRISSRSAFARLICGRERRGYEVSPLTRLDLPESMANELTDYEKQLRARLTVLTDKELVDQSSRILKEAQLISESHPFLDVVLQLDGKASAIRRLIVKSGKLEQGYVIKTSLNPRGIHLPAHIAERLLPAIDGERTVRALVNELVGEGASLSRIGLVRELANLYWYGACNLASQGQDERVISELRGNLPLPIGIPQSAC